MSTPADSTFIIRHLTLTGAFAGVVICGASKSGAGAEFAHAMFADLDDPLVCQRCLAIWNGAESDTPEPTDKCIHCGDSATLLVEDVPFCNECKEVPNG
jgi:hypothetical protein